MLNKKTIRAQFALTLLVLLMVSSASLAQDQVAQVRISPTPLRAVIPTSEPMATQSNLPTPTPTWTPAPEASVSLRIAPGVESANVRAEPDPAGQLLGQIDPNTTYVVTGRYIRWLQFEYPSSPTARGWVFDTLVEIVGDPAEIVDIDPFAAPTANAGEISLTEAFQAVLQTPGAELTITAASRIVELPSGEGNAAVDSAGSSDALPTFTPPPDVRAPSQAQEVTSLGADDETNALADTVSTVLEGGVPPIVPVLLLFGFGALGLFISALRR